MYYHLLVPLAIGALALAVLAIALGHNAYAAFFGLILSSTSQASNPLEWSYPATYLSGPALSSGWAVANCISAYGGMPPAASILLKHAGHLSILHSHLYSCVSGILNYVHIDQILKLWWSRTLLFALCHLCSER